MSLVERLRLQIERTVLGAWDRAPGILIWVLLVGTAAERNGTEKMLFAGHLSLVALCVGLRQYEDVRNMLAKFWCIERLVEKSADIKECTGL